MRCFGVFAVALALAGCASVQAVKGSGGESLVFIKEVKWAGMPSGMGSLAGSAASGPLAGGANPITAGAVGTLAGGVIQAVKGKEIIVAVFDHDPRSANAPKLLVGHNKTLQRKPWPGAEKLQPMTWAIMSKDENGDDIVLPCPSECQPAL